MKKIIFLIFTLSLLLLPWQGAAQISGSTCVNPLVVASVPFNDAGNTATYGNHYGLSDVPPTAPGAVTDGSGTTNYLGNGNDVVYSYTAGSNGSITVNTTHVGGTGWNSLWAFTGCPFASTVGYHTATSGTTRSIPNLPVIAGETYYIVISNWDAGAVDFTIEITGTQVASCLPPTNLGVSNITTTSAELVWNENGTATAWDIEWGTSGFTPTGTPNIAGTTTNPHLLSGLIELTPYEYYIRANCGSGDESSWIGPHSFQTTADCTIYALSVTANNGYVCDEGTGTLTATASGTGDDIYWYDDAVGGNFLGKGSSFETPFITQTTSFWAAEVVLDGSTYLNQGNLSPTTLGSTTNGGITFTLTETASILNFEARSTAAAGGAVTYALIDVGNGNSVLMTHNDVLPAGGTATSPELYIVNLNFNNIPPGNYRLIKQSGAASAYMTGAFPYPLGTAGQVTTGAGSATSTSTLYYHFFNITIDQAVVLCSSNREEVIATVVETIPVEASATATQINPGNSTTLNATSTNSNYIYTWEPATSIAGSNVGASVTTTNLTDHTTFTVTAEDQITGCIATDEITILVFNTALCTTLDITTVTGGYVCDEGTTMLSATNSGIGNEIYWYDAQTGGNRLGIGSTFETPYITETTSFWASEVLLDTAIVTGQAFANPTVFTNSTSNAGGLLFTVNNPITIIDVEVFQTNNTDGDVTIELRDIDNGNAIIATTIASISGGGTATLPTAQTITLNFSVPAAGNYRLVRSGATPTGVGLGNVSAANSNFPYPLGTSGEVTGGSTLTGTSTTQFFFFNWTIEEPLLLCESLRDEVIATVVETIPVEATATATQINPGTSTTLTAVSTNTNYVYTWEPAASISGSNIGATVTTANLTGHTTFTVTATDPTTTCSTEEEIQILVFVLTDCNDLEILTVTDGDICDEGTAILSATAAGITGDNIYWYDDAVGGNRVGKGATFETPVLTQTTSYWAAEVMEEGETLTGEAWLTPNGTGTFTTTRQGLIFQVFEPMTIVEVDVYSTGGGGVVDIELYDNSLPLVAGNEIASVQTTLPGGGSGANPILHKITLNFEVSPGSYRMVRAATPTVAMHGISSAANFGGGYPIPLGNAGELGAITAGANTFTSTGLATAYYFFYNWTISTAFALCESDREEVVATVHEIVPISVSSSAVPTNAVAPGGNTNLTATSTNTNYTYTWEPAASIAGSNVGASVTTTALTDHTTFTVTATDTVTGCEATDEITILVFDTTLCNPLDITATTGDTICVGETANLTATASGTGSVIYWYDEEFDGNKVGVGTAFETPVLTSTTSFWAAEVLLESNYIEAAYTAGSLTYFDATNGAGITFAVQNTNAYEVKMQKLDFYMPANTSFTFQLWYHPTNITGSPGIISAGNGWIQIAGPEFVTSGPTNGIHTAFSNLSFEIPATTIYRFILIGTGADSQFTYVNDTGSPNMFSSEGVNLLVGNNSAGGTGNVGYSGQNPFGTSIGTNPRFFYGAIDFNLELCESAREEAVATVTSNDAPVGDLNQDFAPGETLADLDVTGTNLTWYTDASATTAIPETTLLVDGETYCVSQTVNGCESQLLCITVTLIQPCDAPTALTLVNVTTTTAQFSWTASATETGGYNWVVMEDGDDPLTDTPVASGSTATGITTATASGLDDDTDYDFYVQTNCGSTNLSTWAGPLNFTTDELIFVCSPPTNLTLVNVTDTTADFSWTASPEETNGYSWVVMEDGDDPLIDTPVDSGTTATGITTATASGLDDDTDYDFYVMTDCGANGDSIWAGPLAFTTDVSSPAFPSPYCGPIVFTQAVEPITNVVVAGISNTSGNAVNGSPAHEDFTLVIGTMEQGGTYTIALEGNTDGNFTNRFVVFIDWNQNDILDDAGEVYQIAQTIQNSTGIDGQQAIGSITVPANADLGQTRMRVKKIFGTDDYLNPCLGTGYGQVEDYTIEVLPAPPTCPMPLALNVGAVTNTTIDFSWTIPTDISNVEGYFWRLMASGDDPLVDPPVDEDYVPGATSTSAMITGLTPGTNYDLYLVTVCDQTTLFISDPLMVAVTTGSLCDMPTDVVLEEVDVDFAEFSWTASATETNGYDWAVFDSGDDPLVDPAVASGSVGTGVTSVTVTGLDEATTYDFYVRTDCDPDGMSDWEGPFTFTTDVGAGVNDFGINSIAFYPNPMVDVVNITAQVEIEKVVIFSLTGQKLIEHKVGNTETQLDVSNFASGPYLIHITTSTGKVGIYKLVKK